MLKIWKEIPSKEPGGAPLVRYLLIHHTEVDELYAQIEDQLAQDGPWDQEMSRYRMERARPAARRERELRAERKSTKAPDDFTRGNFYED